MMSSFASGERGVARLIGMASGFAGVVLASSVAAWAHSGSPTTTSRLDQAQHNRTPGHVAPRVPAAPLFQRRPTDLMNLRDRADENGIAETDASSTGKASLGCVANCAGVRGVTSLAVAEPIRITVATMATRAEPAPVTLANFPAATAPSPEPERAVITCVAGCYEGDAKTMHATGGPRPAVLVTTIREQRTAPARLATAPSPAPRIATLTPIVADTATPQPTDMPALKPVRSAAVPLKAAIEPHRRRVAHKTPLKPSRTKAVVAAAISKPKRVVIAKAAAVPAALPSAPVSAVSVSTAPAPVAAAAALPPAQKPERKQVAAAPKKSVVGTDWFNRINKERDAKAKADADAKAAAAAAD